jgi:hypothetical protein
VTERSGRKHWVHWRWQARTPYDELIYLEALRRRGSPLLDQLGAVVETA